MRHPRAIVVALPGLVIAFSCYSTPEDTLLDAARGDASASRGDTGQSDLDGGSCSGADTAVACGSQPYRYLYHGHPCAKEGEHCQDQPCDPYYYNITCECVACRWNCGTECSPPYDGGDDGSDAATDAGRDGGADAGRDAGPPYDAGSCAGAPLAQRVKVSTIDVSPDQAGGGWYQPAVVLSTLPDGRSKVAFNAGDAVKVLTLNDRDQRDGTAPVFAGSDVAGFVAHDDGGALLLVRGEAMDLVKFDDAGAELWKVRFTNNNPRTQDGATWIDWWSNAGRLAWSGTQYAAYFGHTKYFDASILKHQGDMLQYIGPDGKPSGYGWDWGCSHSLDVRIAWNGVMFAPVCLSDCYPAKGIEYNHRGGEISAEPSGNCAGGSSAKLGGLAPTPGAFYVTFTSPEGRASADVAFSRVGNDGALGPKVYLTDTPAVQESAARLAPYGADLLAAWNAGGTYIAAVVDTAGAIVDGPVPLAAGSFNEYDDFTTFANGDVGWAWAEGNAIKVARLRLCP